MSLIRARALRSLQTGLRPAVRTAASRRTQLVARRWASTGGGGRGGDAHASSSDLPWLVGAIAVTVPSCYYLWPSGDHGEPHHGAHHDLEEHEEGESHEEGNESGEQKTQEAPQEDEAPDSAPANESAPSNNSAPNDDSKDDSQDASLGTETTPGQEKDKESEDAAKPSGTEGDSQPTSNDANKKSTGHEEREMKEGSDGSKDNPMKGAIKGEGAKDTRRREPDSKGAFKNRIDSGLGKNLGEGADFDEEGDGPNREAASTAKSTQKDSQGDISGKQMGISTTPTRHSHQIDQDPEKSKKGEGVPETAKSMGTVDVNRPMPESNDRGKKQ